MTEINEWQDEEDIAITEFYDEFPHVGRNELAELLQSAHDGKGTNSFMSLIGRVSERLRE